jgi:hypothetical protein
MFINVCWQAADAHAFRLSGGKPPTSDLFSHKNTMSNCDVALFSLWTFGNCTCVAHKNLYFKKYV